MRSAYAQDLPYPLAAVILGTALHGFCFGCFIFVAFMIVDEETTPDVRASAQSLFNLVIVGIGINIEKRSLFSSDERVELVRQVTKHLSNVEVRQFTGLAVRFVRDCGARIIIRGVRSLTDIEAEFTMTLANRTLDPDIETVFLMSDEEHSHVSSSLIKQIAPLANDDGASTPEDTPVIIDIAANDSDPDGNLDPASANTG